MSSPERRMRMQRTDRNSDESYPDEGSMTDHEVDAMANGDPYDASGARVRSRRSTSPLEDTAEQITRLRQSVSRGMSRRNPSAPGQSMGRTHLSPSDPELDDIDDDVDDGEDARRSQKLPETVYRPVARRRVDSPRDTPTVERISRPPSAGMSSSPPPLDDDDDEPMYDDDDDFTEYDQPRATSWQRPAVRRQSSTLPGLPVAISQADLANDAPALSMIGMSIAGLAAMAILVANRAETLAPTFATHVSASGTLENFEHYSSLWRLPLLTAMLTLMNLVAAWFISPLDRFASRFLLAAAVVVQLIAWVALFRLL